MKSQKQLFKLIMGFWSLAFFMTGLSFALFPDLILDVANKLGESLGFLPATPGSSRLWVALTVSMMMTITVQSMLLYQSPDRYQSMIWPLLTAKLTSSAMGLYYFLFHSQAFAHLMIPLVDFPIAVIIYLAYSHAFSEEASA